MNDYLRGCVTIIAGVSDKTVEYPPWCHAVIVMLIMMSIIWIPLIAFLRWRGNIYLYESCLCKEMVEL